MWWKSQQHFIRMSAWGRDDSEDSFEYLKEDHERSGQNRKEQQRVFGHPGWKYVHGNILNVYQKARIKLGFSQNMDYTASNKWWSRCMFMDLERPPKYTVKWIKCQMICIWFHLFKSSLKPECTRVCACEHV